MSPSPVSTLSRVVCLVVICLFTISGFAQAPAKTAPPAAGEKLKGTPGMGQVTVRADENQQVLQQVNTAMQDLVARVSPAVVQILVTGYGALESEKPGETALIARQRAIGSGVIVD